MDPQLHISNLHLTLDSFELLQRFGEYGTVRSARIVTSDKSGRSRGRGVVEMASPQEALPVMRALDGTECRTRIRLS